MDTEKLKEKLGAIFTCLEALQMPCNKQNTTNLAVCYRLLEEAYAEVVRFEEKEKAKDSTPAVTEEDL